MNQENIKLVYAGFFSRLGAFALDLIPILGYIFAVLVVSLAVTSALIKGQPTGNPLNPVLFDSLAFATVILPVILYFALEESSPKKASWGKRRLELQVVSQSGGRLSLIQALLRSAIKLLPWQIAHTCLFHIPGWPWNPQTPPAWVIGGFITLYAILAVYFISLLIKPKHRTPYDWLAGSVVVKVQEDEIE
jgi:uncharacterized RDD family membrane protein YckC